MWIYIYGSLSYSSENINKKLQTAFTQDVLNAHRVSCAFASLATITVNTHV